MFTKNLNSMDSYIVVKEYLGIKEGTVISPDNDKYIIEVEGNNLEISKTNLDSLDNFEKQDPLSIEEITEESDTKKRYRVQIDINCTETKRKEIESFLRENLNDILN